MESGVIGVFNNTDRVRLVRATSEDLHAVSIERVTWQGYERVS